MKTSKPATEPGAYVVLGKPTEAFTRLANAVIALMSRTGAEAFRVLGPLPGYTVAQLTVPATAGYLNPAHYPRSFVYVSDGASNKHMAISDGADWRFPDGNVVS